MITTACASFKALMFFRMNTSRPITNKITSEIAVSVWVKMAGFEPYPQLTENIHHEIIAHIAHDGQEKIVLPLPL